MQEENEIGFLPILHGQVLLATYKFFSELAFFFRFTIVSFYSEDWVTFLFHLILLS